MLLLVTNVSVPMKLEIRKYYKRKLEVSSTWALQATPLVRLRVRTNSGVKVPVGQSTGCP